MDRKISIPHYNNVQYISQLLENIIDDERVNEIVISDDCSRIEQQTSLRTLIDEFRCDKIILHFNSVNLGNKLFTLSKCANDWTCLIDSDNIIDGNYLDKLYLIDQWDPMKVYALIGAYTFIERDQTPAPITQNSKECT